MTFLEAAEAALKLVGRPMRPDEMVSLAIEKGWIGKVGKTPSATMRAQLGIQVKKGNSVFRRIAPGVFGLKGFIQDMQTDFLNRDRVVGNRAQDHKEKRGRKPTPVGCVYILSNPSFKNDWLKIGQTSDPEPWARMKELYSTPVPLPFSCVAYMQTRRFVEAEKHIHSFIDRFTHKRISEKREFFRMDQKKAVDTLRDVAVMVRGVVHVGPFDVDDDNGTVSVPPVENMENEWRTGRNGIVAKGRYYEDRFEVLAGSQINMAKPAGFAAGNELRRRLKEEGLIVEKRPGLFVLKAKQSFTTPSAASCFVLGGASNGWFEWKNANGEPLDVMRSKRR